MENITKEELKNLLGCKALSDEELENISGGNSEEFNSCMNSCSSNYQSDTTAIKNCVKTNCEKSLFTW